jgi:ribosome recycling factor
MEELESRMKKTFEVTRSDISTVRTGRANPDMLARVQVDYYGSMVPLNQVSSVSVPEPMCLMLNVFDKSAVPSVEKAIMISDLGLNPCTDGNIVRLRLPELTEERRKSLVKIVRDRIEDGKIAIRNIRRDFMDMAKKQEKDKEISEDECKQNSESIQKKTDSFVSQLDSLLKEKELEIMKI